MTFYLTRYFWKAYEGGRMQKMVKYLDKPVLDAAKEKQVVFLAEYLRNFTGKQDNYFYVYAVLEIINLVNVILQILMIDKFLGGEFFDYGLNVLTFTEWNPMVRFDPMVS